MPYLWFGFISLVWGGSFILMKRGAEWLSPVEIAAWRVVGGAVLLSFVWLRKGRKLSLQKKDRLPMALVILCGFIWPFCIQPYLVRRAGSAFIGMMVSFTPLMTIVVSIVMLRNYPTRRQLIGVLGALVCMAVLLHEGRSRQILVVDLALALTVPLCYAFTNTLIRKHLSHVSSLELSLVALLLAGGVLLIASLVTPFERPQASTAIAVRSVAAIAFLGIVGTGVATFLFNRLVQQEGPLFAGMATNVAPIGALTLGWIDAEQVSTNQIAALAGLICMVVIVQFGAVGLRKAREEQSLADR